MGTFRHRRVSMPPSFKVFSTMDIISGTTDDGAPDRFPGKNIIPIAISESLLIFIPRCSINLRKKR
jgi:hypothetical protein